MEGHWKRANTPLRETTPRERLLVRVVAALLAAAVVVSVVVVIVTSGGSGHGNCVDVDVPSTMGGSAIHACGADARAFCRGPLAHSSDLRGRALPACRAEGFAR